MRTIGDSVFDDNTWLGTRGVNLWFDEVFERQRKMRDMVKTYLYNRLTGRYGKSITWSHAEELVSRLRTIAKELENDQQDSFATVTLPWVFDWWRRGKRSQHRKAIVATLRDLLDRRDIQGVPSVNPLELLGPMDLKVVEEIEQTEPINVVWLARILKKALGYEKEVEPLAALVKSHDWTSAYARAAGINCFPALRKRVSDVRAAGAILVLASTGMRVSELTTLKSGSLTCHQNSVWVVRGTVFKFHGDKGQDACWVCGELGRRGFAMLAVCPAGKFLLPKSWKAIAGLYLNAWMDRQDWEEDADYPDNLHAHQFRRTLARLLIREKGINLLTIKEQYKHKSVVMTDYYVGKDGALRSMLLEDSPELSQSLTQMLDKEDDD